MRADKNISDVFTKEDIIAYLQNKLSTDERAVFEERLRNDAFLKDAVEGYKLLPANELHKQIDAVFVDIDMLAGASKKSKLISLQTRPLAIAAMLLLFVGVTWFAVWFTSQSVAEQQIAKNESVFDTEEKQTPEETTPTVPMPTDSIQADAEETRNHFKSKETTSSGVGFLDHMAEDKNVRNDQSVFDIAAEEPPTAISYDDVHANQKAIAQPEGAVIVFNNTKEDDFAGGYTGAANDAKKDVSEVLVTDETVKKDKSGKKQTSESKTEDADLSGVPANQESQAADSIYLFVEQMPQYVGGEAAMIQFIQKNFNMPAGRVEYSGTVFVQFVILETGKVSDILIVKSLEPEIDKEIVRVISIMPNWIPGKQNGVPVKVSYTLPVSIDY
jgi:hypothetical protein